MSVITLSETPRLSKRFAATCNFAVNARFYSLASSDVSDVTTVDELNLLMRAITRESSFAARSGNLWKTTNAGEDSI
jgi:hypothetical protein